VSVEGALAYLSPAGNRLSARLNRVTVRFVEPATFGRRDGVVLPVAEHVFEQMRASNVLGVSRVLAKSPAEAQQRIEAEMAAVREYATLLGEERGLEGIQAMAADFAQLQAAPVMAKATVAHAFAHTRRTKEFGKG
jgi:hypothetical protein